MVSVNLRTGITQDGICSVLLKRIEQGNFKSIISLLDPREIHLIKTVAPLLNVTERTLRREIKEALASLSDFKLSLPKEERNCFEIRVHKQMPFGSGILIDDEKPYGRIQIETKPYGAPLQKSLAFEIVPASNNTECLYQTLRVAYLKLIKEGETYLNDF